jgi:hypothetical protein
MVASSKSTISLAASALVRRLRLTFHSLVIHKMHIFQQSIPPAEAKKQTSQAYYLDWRLVLQRQLCSCDQLAGKATEVCRLSARDRGKLWP